MAVREGRLRRQVRAQLQALDLRPPLDVRELCRRLEEQRQKPLLLFPRAIEVPGPFGLWFGFADRDYIFFQQETPKWHQDHIILHETGHMLAGHPSDSEILDSVTEEIRANPPAGAFFDDEDGEGGTMGRRRRTCYHDPFEQEAELFATMIQEWRSSMAPEPAFPAAGGPGVDRLDRSLTHHQGWR